MIKKLALFSIILLNALSAFAYEGQTTSSFSLSNFSCTYALLEKNVNIIHLVDVKAPDGKVATASVQAALAIAHEGQTNFAHNVEVVCIETQK